jgi:hypothetical protein
MYTFRDLSTFSSSAPCLHPQIKRQRLLGTPRRRPSVQHCHFLRAFLDRDTQARLKHKNFLLLSHPRVVHSKRCQDVCGAYRIANKGRSAETTIGACSDTIPDWPGAGITGATALSVAHAVVLLYKAPDQISHRHRPSTSICGMWEGSVLTFASHPGWRATLEGTARLIPTDIAKRMEEYFIVSRTQGLADVDLFMQTGLTAPKSF